MKMNSLFLTDGYKTGHHQQYPKGTNTVYSNWTPRGTNTHQEVVIKLFHLDNKW